MLNDRYTKKNECAKYIRDKMKVGQIVDLSSRVDKDEMVEIVEELIQLEFPIELNSNYLSKPSFRKISFDELPKFDVDYYKSNKKRDNKPTSEKVIVPPSLK